MATNSTSPFIQVPSLADTYGAVFIGSCLSLVLYGLIIHQTYRYFCLYPRDPIHLKALIVTIFLAETVNTILPVHLCYYHLVANYFNPPTLLDDTLSLRLLAPTSAITILACQSFYAQRVFLVDHRHRVIVVGTIVLLLIETGFSIVVTVQAFKGRQHIVFWPVNILRPLQWIISVYYGLDMAIDFTLAGTLVVFLLRSHTGTERKANLVMDGAFREPDHNMVYRNDSMIQTLVLYTINTGLVTSIVGMLAFIFALIKPRNLVYFAMGIIVTKLYANSVLALLNTRRYLSSLSQAMDAFDAQSTLLFSHTVCHHCNTIQTAPQVIASLPTSGDSGSRGWSHTNLQESFEMHPPRDRRGVADSTTSSRAEIRMKPSNAV